MFGPDFNLITTMIGFGMSACFIVFVCTRMVCTKARGAESEVESTIDLEQPPPRAAGLEPALISAISTMRYTREAFISAEDEQCSICLAEYQGGDVLRIMPKCGHKFHVPCVDVWLRKQSTCPVCRFSLDNSAETKHVSALIS